MPRLEDTALIAEKGILIIHELKPAVDTLVSLFKGQPLLVAGATTANEARYLFGLLKPDLIIASIHQDWLPLVVHFRSAQPTLEIIGVTHSDESAQNARRLGIDNIVLIGSHPEGWAAGIQPVLGDWLSAPQPSNDVTILIVDDEIEVLDLLCSELADEGYTVRAADSGKVALEIAERDPSISLVVLDVVMPDMGGLETLQKLKDLRTELEFIMISAFADRAIVREAFSLGASDFLLKPVDRILLENSVMACQARAAFRKQSWWKRRAARHG
jgi:CheY-like chemotaxis protein